MAYWEADAYTIIYDANGGNIQEEHKLNRDVYIVSSSLATTYANNGQDKQIYNNLYQKQGYTFKEWNTKADGTGTPYAVNDIVQLSNVEDDTLRLYAIWEKQSYSVTFDANEGMFDDNKRTIVIEEWEDNKLDSLEKPKRAGYAFKGYYTEKAGGISLENYIAEVGININGLVFYAQWEIIKYTVTFNANSGNGVMNIQEFTYDTSKKLTKNAFTRVGYTFTGWNTSEDGSGKNYNDNQEIMITEDLVLYAQWSPNQHKITFNVNDGTDMTTIQNVYYDESIKLNKNTFIRERHTFTGWNTSEDGSGTAYSDEHEITITGDLVLYAQWRNDTTYVINIYSVDEVNKYIDLIEVGTTLDEFKNNIILGEGYTIEVDTKEVNEEKVLFAGGKTKIYKDGSLYVEYTNIVRGDADGDGDMNIFDYIRIMKDIMNETKLIGVYKKAADVNQNDEVDIFDYIRIMKIIMEEN